MSSYPIDIENHDEDPIILNVGGVKYEVMPSTLAQYPETLLGHIFHPNNRHLRKPDKKGEFFFDRNGASFDVILNYYRTGKIVIPPNASEEIIREELKYFKIDYKGNLGSNSNNNNNNNNSSTEEDEDVKVMKQPKDEIYQYAQGLINSGNRSDIKRGLKFLGKLREMEPNNYLYRYSFSFACYRLGENVKGIQALQEILATDQHNPQAKSLLTLFNDVRLSNTRNGIVMCCLAAVGIYGFLKVRKWYQLAKLINGATKDNIIPTAANVIKSVGNSVVSGGASTTLSSSIPHAIVSKIPEKIVNHVVDSVVNNTIEKAVTTASSVANNTFNTITEASINSLSQSNIQSIPIDQFNQLMSGTFSSK
ncbi:hypothetical protein RB653_002776 [Dictyostelium firmibasis]|uniref:BTB domain-containing protein n=1 Tax=Dictyostelium firmibasis TaxID=79012 RepID=A0AAN7TY65_9MYCE